MDSNSFCLYQYDPVDTLGDILPFHIQSLDTRLRESRYYDANKYIKSGCCKIFFNFLFVLSLLFLLVFGIIVLASIIGVWTIPAAFLLAFVLFGVGFLIISGINMIKSKSIDKMLTARTNEFNYILNQFISEEPIFRELQHVSISLGQFGSYLQFNYGEEYKQRVSGVKAHRPNNYADASYKMQAKPKN